MTTPNALREFKLLQCLLAVLILGTAAQAIPQELDNFRVEVIVLRHLNPVFGSEIWTTPSQDEADIAPAERFAPLAAGDLQLSKMTGRLANSKNFRVVSHSGWIQPGYPRDDARRKIIARSASTGESVKGHITVTRERYLRMNLDLVMTIDGAQYQMRTGRRMLSRQANYFDHPHFGVIAIIEPI